MDVYAVAVAVAVAVLGNHRADVKGLSAIISGTEIPDPTTQRGYLGEPGAGG